MKIDSHQHFWIYSKADYGWIGDGMEVIMRDHLPEHLSLELKKIGFDGSLAVQARQSLKETEWLLELATQSDIIKGVVGWVDLRSNLLKQQLEKYTQHTKFVGVRHVLQDEPDDDFMLGKDFLSGIKLLKEFDLTYDILIFPKHLPNAVKFVSLFPDQTFVLDHIAKPLIRDQKISPWKEDIKQLAKFPNVFCKLSGMVTEASWNSCKSQDFKPFLDVVFQAFGTDRLMIGSDWPVCRLVNEYPSTMSIVTDYLNDFSAEDKAKVLGENAIKAYKLKI
jgi:L-fuconolactonase